MKEMGPIRMQDTTELFRKSYGMLPIPVLVLDSDCKIVVANSAFSEALGLEREIVGENLESLSEILGNSYQVLNILKGVVDSGLDSAKAELEMNCAHSGKFAFLMNSRKISMDESGKYQFLFVFHDITNNRKVEKRLRLTAEKFRSMLLLAKDAVLIVKADGNIEFANQTAESYFCYSSKELIGMPYAMLIRSIAVEQTEDGMKQERFQGIRKNGSEFPVEISQSQVKVNGDHYQSVIIRDVTELKKLEEIRIRLIASEKEAREIAEKSNQTKDLFLATLSHELRTPLTSILSWSQLIQKMKMNPEKINHAASAIEQNALIQGQLIEDLLDLARIQSGKLALHLSEVDPAQVVCASIESVRFLSQKKGIRINSTIQQDIPQVFVDSSRLQQIIWNLLTNAIKFSPVESSIDVFVGKRDQCVEIIVQDHGKGISEDFLPSIFKRFSQEDNSSIRAHGGLGLGLALVNDLVKMQHGTVKAESEGVGKGARFTVRFPALTQKVVGLDEYLRIAEVVDADLHGARILLVDDEPDLLESISTALRFYGAEVVTASSVSTALEKIDQQLPDLVISDIAMPKEDGYSLITKIRSRGPENGGGIPAIAFTAYAGKDDELKAKKAGFQVHLAKPVKSMHLAEVSARLLLNAQNPSSSATVPHLG
jgi:PAS domain S-box-containing protein